MGWPRSSNARRSFGNAPAPLPTPSAKMPYAASLTLRGTYYAPGRVGSDEWPVATSSAHATRRGERLAPGTESGKGGVTNVPFHAERRAVALAGRGLDRRV